MQFRVEIGNLGALSLLSFLFIYTSKLQDPLKDSQKR